MLTEKRTWLIVGLGMAVLAGIVLSIGIGFWRPDPRETPSADARPLQRPVALEEPVEPPTPIAWTKITEPGHFSVMFPGMPERLTGNSLDGPVGSYTFQRHGGREMFLVNWNDLPPASAAVEPNIILGDYAARAGSGAKRKDIDLQGHPGIELRSEAAHPPSVLIHRIYVANQGVYQLIVSGPSATLDPGVAARFLDSFQLAGKN